MAVANEGVDNRSVRSGRPKKPVADSYVALDFVLSNQLKLTVAALVVMHALPKWKASAIGIDASFLV
jgi:hypothetical protein